MADDEIGLLSQKISAPNTVEWLNALRDDIITCSTLVKGENKPHLLENKLFLKALVSRLPMKYENKFQDNLQANTTEFTFDALLKFITRTVTLSEGALLWSGFADRLNTSKGSGTTSQTNKNENRIVSMMQSAAETPAQPVPVNGAAAKSKIYVTLWGYSLSWLAWKFYRA